MQKPCKINVNISEYDRLTRAGEWEFPKEEGYKSNGYYERYAIDENGQCRKIKIRVNKSKDRNRKKKKCISYLPDQLVPYNRHPVGLTTEVVNIWKRFGKSVKETVDEICRIYDERCEEVAHDLYELGSSQLKKFEEIYEDAWRKYIVWQRIGRDYTINKFIGMCAQNNCHYAEVVGDKYYQANGGRFLFGTASQFRNKPG